MILIFDTIGGLSDQIKDITSILYFCNENNFQFTFRNATSRPIENPSIYNFYEFHNLFDPHSFSNNKQYILYDDIKKNINIDNTYNFHKEKIIGKLFKDEFKEYLKNIKENMIDIIRSCNKEFIIMGGAFWSYNTYNYDENIINMIKPSNKILDKYNEIIQKMNCNEYNFIHYRYEEDWNILLTRRNIVYIRPILDDIILNISFKKDLPIYICTSCIETLYEKNWMLYPLSAYSNILYKNADDMIGFNYDECGYIDFLIGKKSQEIYGFSRSGFSINLNALKKTKNYYDLLDFSKYAENSS